MIEKSDIAFITAVVFIANSINNIIISLSIGLLLIITFFIFKISETKKDAEILQRLKNGNNTNHNNTSITNNDS